jgi:hypothetical protein
MFDTVVSCLRIYSVTELRDLTTGLDRYRWDIGTVRGKTVPIWVTYLIGGPVEDAAEQALHPSAAGVVNGRG